MSRVNKTIKSFITMLLIISVNSFAAIVADNDGSAFITKAEFFWRRFKVGSFSNDEEVTDANAKDRIEIKDIKGQNITTSTRANAVRLKGGKGTVEFQMPKNGYIFFKWSLASSTTLGGGTFYPEKTVKVTDA